MEKTAPLLEEEKAYEALDTPEEKAYFKRILDIDRETDGYVCTKRPRLSVGYYVYKYKENGISFSKYLEETKEELSLLESEIVLTDAGFKQQTKTGMRAITARRLEETIEERKRGRKQNFRYAILILVILFLMICAFFFK